MTTLEQRVATLERHHRRRWLRRAVKAGLLFALLLLLLWLWMDALHMHMVVDALQRQAIDNASAIGDIHTQVADVKHAVDGLTLKINGVVQPTQPVLPAAHSGVTLPHLNMSPVLGGMAGMIAGLARLLPLVFA